MLFPSMSLLCSFLPWCDDRSHWHVSPRHCCDHWGQAREAAEGRGGGKSHGSRADVQSDWNSVTLPPSGLEVHNKFLILMHKLCDLAKIQRTLFSRPTEGFGVCCTRLITEFNTIKFHLIIITFIILAFMSWLEGTLVAPIPLAQLMLPS